MCISLSNASWWLQDTTDSQKVSRSPEYFCDVRSRLWCRSIFIEAFIAFLQSTCPTLSPCTVQVEAGQLDFRHRRSQRILMREALECERALHETSCIFLLMWPELITESYKFLMSEAICSQEMFITHIWWLKWVPWATICGFELLQNIQTGHPSPLRLTSRGLWRRAGIGTNYDCGFSELAL